MLALLDVLKMAKEVLELRKLKLVEHFGLRWLNLLLTESQAAR